MASQIKLTQGKVALVDDSDVEFLSQWKWCYGNGYATRAAYPKGLKGVAIHILMHRQVMGFIEGFMVDHINRNGLDNRKENLRIATASNNQWNKALQSNNTSGHKGVTWDRGRWRAAVNMKDSYRHIGRFKTIEEAVEARIKFIQELHGEFARQV